MLKIYTLRIIITAFLLITTVLFLGTFNISDIAEYWQPYMEISSEPGLMINGYQYCDEIQPPLSYFVLAVISHLIENHNISSIDGLKVFNVIVLFGSVFLFYWYTKDFKKSSLLYIALMQGVMAGYLDIYLAPLLTAALFFLFKKNYVLFSILYTISCFVKLLPLVLAPFFMLYVLKELDRSKKAIREQLWFLGKIAMPALLVSVFIIFIFGFKTITAVFYAISYEGLSTEALNVHWLMQGVLFQFAQWFSFNQETIPVVLFFKAVFMGIYSYLLFLFSRTKNTPQTVLFFSMLGFYTYYIFNSSANENHLFVVMLLAAVLFYFNTNSWYVFLGIALMHNINQFITLPWLITHGWSSGVVSLSLGLALLNIVFYIFLLGITIKKGKLLKGLLIN